MAVRIRLGIIIDEVTLIAQMRFADVRCLNIKIGLC